MAHGGFLYATARARRCLWTDLGELAGPAGRARRLWEAACTDVCGVIVCVHTRTRQAVRAWRRGVSDNPVCAAAGLMCTEVICCELAHGRSVKPPTHLDHSRVSVGGWGHITHRHIRLYEVRVVAHM